MNKPLILTTLILSILLAGCNSPCQEEYEFLSRQSLSDPFFLHKSYELTRDSTSDEETQKLNELLFITASRRSGAKRNNEASIQAVEDYFLSRDAKLPLASARFEHAAILRENGNIPAAASLITKAYKTASDYDNQILLTEISLETAYIHRICGNKTYAKIYALRAVEHAEKTNWPQLMNKAYNSAGRISLEEGNKKEAKRYLYKNKGILGRLGRVEQGDIMCLAAECLLKEGCPEKAMKYIKSSDMLYPSSLSSLVYGDINLALGDTLSAKKYYTFATNSFDNEILKETALRLVELYEYNKDKNKEDLLFASRMLNKAFLGQDKVEAEKAEKIMKEMDRDDSPLPYLVALFLLCASSSATYIIWKRKRKPAVKNNLEGLMNDKIVATLRERCESAEKCTPYDWIELHKAVNLHTPTFLPHLREHEDLSAKEINLCILILLNFAPGQSATALDTSPQNITNMRRRLLKKIFNTDGGAVDFDNMIRLSIK